MKDNGISDYTKFDFMYGKDKASGSGKEWLTLTVKLALVISALIGATTLI